MFTHAFHIFRKDLRALRFPLVGWSVLLLGGAILCCPWGISAGEQIAAGFSALANAAAGFAALILAALAVGQDLPGSTTAAWTTRPARGSALFGAKLMFVGLLAAIWFAAQAIPAIALGLAAALPAIAIQVLTAYLPALLAAGALAALFGGARSFGKMIAAAVAVVAVLSYLYTRSGHLFPLGAAFESGVPRNAIHGIEMSLGLASRVFGGLLFAGIMAWQYIVRRTKPGIGIALAATAVFLASTFSWKANFFEPSKPPAGADAITISVTDQPLLSGFSMTTEFETHDARHVSVMLETTGIPDGSWLSARTTDATFEIPGEPVVTTFGAGSLQHFNESEFSNAVPLTAADGTAFERVGDRSHPARLTVFALPRDDYRIVAGKSGTLRITVAAKLKRFRQLGEIPLKEGATMEGDWHKARLERIIPQMVTATQTADGKTETRIYADGLNLQISEAIADLPFPPVSRRSLPQPWNGDPPFYTLLNRAQNVALFQSSGGMSHGDLPFHWLARTNRQEQFSNHHDPDHKMQMAFDQEMIAATTLAAFEVETLGTFEREIVIEGFTMPAR